MLGTNENMFVLVQLLCFSVNTASWNWRGTWHSVLARWGYSETRRGSRHPDGFQASRYSNFRSHVTYVVQESYTMCESIFLCEENKESCLYWNLTKSSVGSLQSQNVKLWDSAAALMYSFMFRCLSSIAKARWKSFCSFICWKCR